MSKEKSGESSKRLVKILVILGIGIPVLVELMTLFNLINVQIFEADQQVELFPGRQKGYHLQQIPGHLPYWRYH